MKRRMSSIITTLALCLSLCPTWTFALDAAPARAAGDVSADYQEASWNGAVTYTKQTAEHCTSVTDSTTEWTAGWYVVTGAITIDQPITVSGDVSLILADGCTLNATQGIVVAAGNSLTIYAQTGGTGTLNATGVPDNAGNTSSGIGGDTKDINSGTITIHGGRITATGGDGSACSCGAGIGGGGYSISNGGSSGAVTIYGGTIIANSGEGGTTGAGIGGGGGGNALNGTGNGGDGSHITIYGGHVTATSRGTSTGGAGIGGGTACFNGGAGSDIKIFGGIVNATGGAGGAGIGGGSGGNSNKSGGVGTGITISGGIVDARGGAGNAGGESAGDPIGNGGNASGGADVTKTAGIIFENGVGEVRGTVTLDGEYTVPDGYTLTFAEGGELGGKYACYQDGGFLEMERIKSNGITGPVTLKECEHTGIVFLPEYDGTHRFSCHYCDVNEKTACFYEFKERMGVCKTCMDEIYISVNGTDDLIYDGAAKELTVTIARDGAAQMEEGKEFTVAYANNTNAGTDSMTMTITIGNNQGTYTERFSIEKATPTVTPPTATLEYGQRLSDSTLTGGTAVNPNGNAAVAGTWSWVSPHTQPAEAGAFAAAFTPTDTTNYNSPEAVEGNVTVLPTAPEITLTVPAYQVAGEEVSVTYQAENPYDANWKDDLPGAALTYKIGDGEEQPVTGGKFRIPADTAVGTQITVTAVTDGVDNKYVAARKTATVEVTDKIPVEITGVSVPERVYNGQAIEPTGTPVVKTLSGQTVTDVSVTYTWTTADGEAPVNAGDYALEIAVDDGKYLGKTTMDCTISRASITITAEDTSATVGSAQPELTYTVSGLAPGEVLAAEPTLACDPDMDTVGRYPITASGAAVPDSGNYNTEITYVEGTLSVTAKPSGDGGSAPSGGPSTPTVTIPVSGGQGTVSVSASVSGSTVTVSKIDTTQIDSVIGDGTQTSMVEMDFTGLDKTIDTVKLPAAALEDLAAKAQDSSVEGLTVKLTTGELSFDGDALAAIQAQAGSQLTLTVTPAKASDLSDRQKEAVGSAPVYDLTLQSDGNRITDFRGGHATVALPYTLAEEQEPAGVIVCYLDAAGNITPCATTYDENSRLAIFTTGHLSLYFVGYDPAEAWMNPFSDVDEGAWYYDAVRFVNQNGFMSGYGNGTFGPHEFLSRAMLAQILYNRAGSPAVTGGSVFTDVADGQWYAPAITWAAANGIVDGCGNGLFGPDDNITREQLAVMLWRYAGSPAATDKELHFADADEASDYAREALCWAAEHGVLNGSGDGQLEPKGLATRGQVAQMLMNLLNSK